MKRTDMTMQHRVNLKSYETFKETLLEEKDNVNRVANYRFLKTYIAFPEQELDWVTAYRFGSKSFYKLLEHNETARIIKYKQTYYLDWLKWKGFSAKRKYEFNVVAKSKSSKQRIFTVKIERTLKAVSKPERHGYGYYKCTKKALLKWYAPIGCVDVHYKYKIYEGDNLLHSTISNTHNEYRRRRLLRNSGGDS